MHWVYRFAPPLNSFMKVLMEGGYGMEHQHHQRHRDTENAGSAATGHGMDGENTGRVLTRMTPKKAKSKPKKKSRLKKKE